MYLSQMLSSFASDKHKFSAEDLYKLNEAVFNLPEEDQIDKKMSAKLFAAVQKVAKAYETGRYDKSDPNFFYDYVALLGTMQNQHFFTTKHNEMMLGWLVEAVGAEGGMEVPAKPAKAAAPAATKEIAKLEAENEALRKELEKAKELSNAALVLKTFKLPTLLTDPTADEKPKAKAKAKGKAKAKARGKGKAKEAKEGEAPPAEAEKPSEG